jgi:NitT/TauT family transport system ATP-binding protein
MLEVTRLSKEYDSDDPSARVTVLSDFSLRVPAGDFAVLVGPSGCGKTSFFDILVGSVRADSGGVAWNGVSVPNLCGICAYMQQKDLFCPGFPSSKTLCFPGGFAGPSPGRHRRGSGVVRSARA